MTIDEAIETSEAIQKSTRLQNWPEAHKAIRLGEEALKEIKRARNEFLIISDALLPEETEG
ncbi:hypothetical protein ES708_31666 [subsurface metagenome]